MMKYRQVFWDWNGTLLDDLDYAIGVRNRIFPLFGLPKIESLAEYFQQFTFPVREYYYRAGVTEENFDQVAHAWMNEYVRGQDTILLHGDAKETLSRLAGAGLSQVVLSASQIDILKKQLSLYGLENAFQDVLGHDNIYADSKETIGIRYMEKVGLSAAECVMIGDTLHDAEVARAMGVDCILVARGHQSAETLQTAGVPVAQSLAQAAEIILQ